MKEDWKECKLGEVCNISSSKRIFAEEYTTEGIPFYRGKEIIEKRNKISISSELFISYERFEEIKTKFSVPKIGDILLTSVGTIGVPWLVNEENFYFKDGNLTWLRCNNKFIHSPFLYYWLESDYSKNQINAKCIGSTQKALTIDTLCKFEITLPPLATQQKIATILSSLDDKIELNNKINDNLEQQAQAIFKSWFVDFEPFDGVMPKGWKEMKAEDYFDITIGKTPPRKEQEWFSEKKLDNNVKWVSISDMGNCGTFISETSEYLTSEATKKFNIKIIPKDTVILSFKLTVGRVAITDDTMCTNEAIAHFGIDTLNVLEYLYIYLKNFNYQTMGSTSSIATAVNSKIIKAMPFVLPDEKTINNFHQATNSLFEKIRENQHENRTLTTIRNTLLPKLMNGEIEVGIK